MTRRPLLILFATAGLGAGQLCGQPVRGGGQASLDTLIRQLEHPDFRKRNDAEQRLIDLGTVNISALEAAAATGGAELKYRTERVLNELRELQAKEQLDCLKEDPWTVGGKITDVWERFHELAGDSPAARALFINMMERDPQLTLAPAESPAVEQALLESRCMELRNLQQLVRAEPVRVGNAASILFVTLVSRQKASPLTVSVANSVIDSPDFLQKMNDGRTGPPLRALLAQWIMRSGLVSAHSRLMLAVRYEIPEGVFPAREMISDGELKTSQPQIPILYLAKHAGTDALSDLGPLLQETKVVASSTQGTTQGEVTFTSEVRDVALAAMLHLTGQEAADYGFSRIKPDSRYIYAPVSIGFESEQQRKAAFTRWQQWRNRHLPGPLKPWPDASEGRLADFRFRILDFGLEWALFKNGQRRTHGMSWVPDRRAFCPKSKIPNRKSQFA